MNRSTGYVGVAVALAFLTGVSFAGSLTPPAGPVAPTPGPEPRIAVNSTNTPGDSDSVFKISAPGSYYLTGNVTGVSGKYGIEVNASGVTLDLNGFEVLGVAGSLDGIRGSATNIRNITIRNGSIRNWGGDGVTFTFVDTTSLFFERLMSSDNGESGIGTSASGCSFTDCTATGNGFGGITAGTGARVTSCLARDNTTGGIYASQGSTVVGCTAHANGDAGITVGFGCTVVDCTADDNVGDGFHASNGSTIIGCSAMFNAGNGIYAFTGITIRECTTYSNVLNGIDASGTCIIEGCISRSNTLDGIECSSSCVVRGNACTSNGAGAEIGAGINATGSNNRIEGNNCTSNDFGIDIDTAGNVIVRNTCADNTQNFLIVADNIYGTIADRTAPGSPIVIGDSATGTMGSTDPNANFSY